MRVDTAVGTTLDALVRRFLDDHASPTVVGAAFGVAGPVVNGRAQLTNHPWTIDAAQLSTALGVPVRVLNDLEALAYSLDALDAGEVSTLHAGGPRPSGLAAVVGVGTGLGAALLVRAGERRVACPTESGHADFAPRSAREDQLVTALRRAYGRATIEHVVSGRGLVNLHRFTHDGRRCAAVSSLPEPEWPAAIAGAGGGSGAPQCPACADALASFASALAGEVGNIALRCLPFGGLYLGGGVSLALRPLLETPRFVETLLDKPPMRAVLEGVPVRLILTPHAGLLGAAAAASAL